MAATLVMASVFAVGLGCKDNKPDTQEPQKTTNDAQENVKQEVATPETKAEEAQQANIPAGARALIDAYPDFIKGYSNNKILFKDGTEMTYDDGRQKSFVQKLDDSDIEDMFAFKYDLNSWTPGFQQDAGRSRNEALFKKMYGNSAAAVRKHLVSVPWFGQSVLFTTVNGAAEHLKAVRDELAKHPEFKAYFKSEGSFYWRQVRGAATTRPTGCGQSPVRKKPTTCLTRTRCRTRLWKSSRSTVSSGADAGITTTLCTSSIARRFC